MTGKLTFTSPQKITIVESILDQVVCQIRDGVLKPGDKLPSERQMIEMLGVSRSSVREAMQGLSAMGLVEIRPGYGTFVKDLRPHFSLADDSSTFTNELQREMRHDLNQARLVLEQGILSVIIANIDSESAAKIMRALEAYEASTEAEIDTFNWTAHDAVHLAIAETSRNHFLVQILQRLLDIVPNLLRDKGLINDNPEETCRNAKLEKCIHRELCTAIVRGDIDQAHYWLEQHFAHEEEIIQNYYGAIDQL